MLTGAHIVIQSENPAADRAFLSDMMKLTTVDAGGGYVILGLPPAEVSVHLGRGDNAHELYLMCDDVNALIEEMGRRNIACDPVQDEGWGLVTRVTLPGGGKLAIYEPRHARPPVVAARSARNTKKRGMTKKTRKPIRKARKAKRSR